MVAAPFQHFKALVWKNLLIELDTVSKFIWTIVSILLFGMVFGIVMKTADSPLVNKLLKCVFMFLQCGFLGRIIALNLIRDRKVKFRLTLQLVGVNQFTYLSANFIFALVFGIIQISLLFVSTIFFGHLFLPDVQSTTTADNSDTFSFLISTILFLLAFIAMCAAFSSIVMQYDFAGEIIGKFTFLCIFIPLGVIISSLFSALSSADPDALLSLGRVKWVFIWLPNVTYIQLGAMYAITDLGKNFIDPTKLGSVNSFNLAFTVQIVGYLLVYYVLDRTISTDTGSQRQFISTSSNTLNEISEESLEQGSRAGLLANKGSEAFDTSQNVIKIRNLVKKFGDFAAIRGINADIHSNTITTLLGHNGAGKTTLIDILTGFQLPSEGGVYLNGRNIHSNVEMLYGKVGYASSHDPLFEEITVQNFLVLMAKLKGCEDPLGEAYKVGRETHLEPHMMKKIRECSGGTKRRVSISASLVGNPSIVFLDEPSTGVDPENRRALWASINAMKRPDRIIMLTTHHLEEAEFLSRDVLIMTKGQITVRGSPEQIKADLGIGYKLVLSNIKGREQEVFSILQPFEPYMNIEKAKLESIGEILIEMKKNTNEITIQLIEKFTSIDLPHTILSSTLEDAFINMAENEEDLEIEEARNKLIEKLFNKKFETNNAKKFGALIIRKIFLLFRNLLQIIVIVMLVAIPSCMTYFIVSITYTSLNPIKYSSRSRPKVKIEGSILGFLNIICIVYYTFSCGFFGLIPVVERVGRIRYLMKMNNVSWISYLPTLFIPDLLIGFLVIGTTYGITIGLVYDMIQNIDRATIFLLYLNLMVWIMTFIAQSYFISFFFESKDSAYKKLTQTMLLSNLIAVLGLGLVAYFENDELLRIALAVFNVLFPGYSNIQYNISTISRKTSLKFDELYTILLRSAICFVLFFAGALFMDYNSNKIKKADNQGAGESIDNSVFDRTSVAQEVTDAHSSTNELPIQIRNVSKIFGNTRALTNVNLTLKPREILGLIGPNGAGKSTMFNIVSNYFSPSSGVIKYHGYDLDQHLDFYDKTGLCAQDDIIWPELSLDQHLEFYGRLKGVGKETREEWKVLLGLESFGSFNAINLSTGMKRKLCYIISMMTNPQYKFLDEPTSGLDPVSRKLMRKLIIEQKRIYGGSTVFTTHTMKDAEDLCDRVAILVNGRLTCIDTVNNLRTKTGGINVSILRNLSNPVDEQNIMNVYVQTFPECLDMGRPIVTDSTERKLVFFAHNIQNIAGKMRLLNEAKKSGYILDYEVSQRSLEDLFLYLASNQTRRIS